MAVALGHLWGTPASLRDPTWRNVRPSHLTLCTCMDHIHDCKSGIRSMRDLMAPLLGLQRLLLAYPLHCMPLPVLGTGCTRTPYSAEDVPARPAFHQRSNCLFRSAGSGNRHRGQRAVCYTWCHIVHLDNDTRSSRGRGRHQAFR